MGACRRQIPSRSHIQGLRVNSMKIPMTEISNRILEEWHAIAQGSHQSNIFLHPAWFTGYREAFPDAHEASVYSTSNQGRLSTLAAFRFAEEKVFGLSVGMRVGRFMLHELADYNGFISEQKDATEDILSILEESRQLEKWDLLFLKDISSQDSLLLSLADINKRGYPYTLIKGNLCPYLTLDGTFEDYVSKQLGNSSSHVKILSKAIKAKGFKTTEEESIPASEFTIDEMSEVEGKSWKAESGLFSTPEKRQFYQHVLSRLHAEGRVQYMMCSASGKPMAYTLGFYFNERWNYYTTAHCAEDNRYSFGRASTLLTLKKLFGLGLKEADFLRGVESSKYALTSLARQNYDLYVFSSTWAKAAFDSAQFMRRKIKQSIRKKSYRWPGRVQEFSLISA